MENYIEMPIDNETIAVFKSHIVAVMPYGKGCVVYINHPIHKQIELDDFTYSEILKLMES